MTDPQDIEVEPTPEERCSVAMAALVVCCKKVEYERIDGNWIIRAYVATGMYIYTRCEDTPTGFANAAIYLHEQVLAIGRCAR